MVSIFDVTVSDGFDHKEEILMLGNFQIMNQNKCGVHSIGTVIASYAICSFDDPSAFYRLAVQSWQMQHRVYNVEMASNLFFHPPNLSLLCFSVSLASHNNGTCK